MFYRFFRGFFRLLFMLLFGIRAYGQQNVPERGGVLLLSNHQSFLDPPLVGVPISRQLGYLARRSLFRGALFGWVIRSLGAMPVRRGAADRAAIRCAIERLLAGEALVMFPEGTRSRDGALQPIRGGFRLLVRKAGVPVVPVAVDGAYRAWPRGRFLPRPRRIRVSYGRPIPAADLVELTDAEAGERLTREISSLLSRLQRLS